MYEELLAAIKQLTIAVNGVSTALGFILIVLVLKNTNSSAAIYALRNDVNNVKTEISNLSMNLCAELRNKGEQDDV